MKTETKYYFVFATACWKFDQKSDASYPKMKEIAHLSFSGKISQNTFIFLYYCRKWARSFILVQPCDLIRFC